MKSNLMFSQGITGGTQLLTGRAIKARMVDMHGLNVGGQILFGLGHFGTVRALETVGGHGDDLAHDHVVKLSQVLHNNST